MGKGNYMGELLKFEGELTKPSVERKAEKPNSCKKRGCSFETASSK